MFGRIIRGRLEQQNNQFARRSQKQAQLFLEPLETRITPTDYVWSGPAGGGNWEVNDNWMPNTGYPGSGGSVTDSATFYNRVGDATMTTGHTLAFLSMSRYPAALRLQGLLKLTNGGGMDGGQIIQRDAIANGDIEIAGGIFSFSDGRINAPDGGSVPGFLTIDSGAEVDFIALPTSLARLGDHVEISSSARLVLANTGPITLVYGPVITNSGTIDVRLDSAYGLSRGPSSTQQTIDNTGVVRKSAGTGTYKIDEPIYNHSGGFILVSTGILQFTGTAATGPGSVLNDGGTIRIVTGATLKADGLTQGPGPMPTYPGYIQTVGSGPKSAIIDVGTSVVLIQEGYVYAGDGVSVTARIDITGDFAAPGGYLNLVYNTDTMTSSSITATGRMTFGGGGGSCYIDMHFAGSQQEPDRFTIMTSQGIMSGTCGIDNPPMGWTSDTSDMHNYVLRRSSLAEPKNTMAAWQVVAQALSVTEVIGKPGSATFMSPSVVDLDQSRERVALGAVSETHVNPSLPRVKQVGRDDSKGPFLEAVVPQFLYGLPA